VGRKKTEKRRGGGRGPPVYGAITSARITLSYVGCATSYEAGRDRGSGGQVGKKHDTRGGKTHMRTISGLAGETRPTLTRKEKKEEDCDKPEGPCAGRPRIRQSNFSIRLGGSPRILTPTRKDGQIEKLRKRGGKKKDRKKRFGH